MTGTNLDIGGVDSKIAEKLVKNFKKIKRFKIIRFVKEGTSFQKDTNIARETSMLLIDFGLANLSFIAITILKFFNKYKSKDGKPITLRNTEEMKPIIIKQGDSKDIIKQKLKQIKRAYAKRKRKEIEDKIVTWFEKGSPFVAKAKNKKTATIIEILLIAFAIFILFYGLSQAPEIIRFFFDILGKNFGARTMNNTWAIVIFLILIFVSFWLLRIVTQFISNKEEPYMLFMIISGMLGVLLIGLVFIDGVTGDPHYEWDFHDQQGGVAFSIEINNLIEGELADFKINGLNESLKVEKLFISYLLLNGSTTQDLTINYTFIVPYEVKHVDMSLLLKKSNNSYEYFDTGFYPIIYSRSETDERKRNFLTYFFGLFFISFITLPTILIKIEKAIREEKDRLARKKSISK